MMYGLNESFDYLECSNCGCLQITDIPEEMGKYYPEDNYYSFKRNKLNFILKNLSNRRNGYCLFKNSFVGKIINKFYPEDLFPILGCLKIDCDSKILDVGCGHGTFLHNLAELNFKNLTGIDPHIKKEVNGKNLNILKKTIDQLSDDENFDIIIFNHSFEHIKEQKETLNKAYELLSPNGRCIISMPVKTDYIWNLYGTDWVQIDAPRHFFIHTLKSFQFLCEIVNFSIENIIFNSTEFQFLGSEQYKQGIPLNADNSHSVSLKKIMFPSKHVKNLKRKAEILNKNQEGDQAIFILNK